MSEIKVCPTCGYKNKTKSFIYCPKCGKKLENVIEDSKLLLNGMIETDDESYRVSKDYRIEDFSGSEILDFRKSNICELTELLKEFKKIGFKLDYICDNAGLSTIDLRVSKIPLFSIHINYINGPENIAKLFNWVVDEKISDRDCKKYFDRICYHTKLYNSLSDDQKLRLEMGDNSDGK